MEPNEEERKRYDYQSPTGTYYGEPGNDQSEIYRKMFADYASKTDPQKQAEEDARIQRGRNFWTGANLFANVVANAINARGTAKGAPNMTFNDAASQKMYDSWKEADKQLKADRLGAQQRYEALAMQDAALTAAGKEKRAAEQKNIHDVNFNIQREDDKWKRQQEADAAKTQTQQQFQKEMEGIRHRNTISAQNNAAQNAQATAEARAQASKGYNKGTKTIRIGNTDFKAETEAEADSNIAQVYGMVLAAYNKNQDALHQQTFDGKPETEYSFINAHINQLYANDPEFKAQYDAFVRDHQRSVNQNHGSQQQGSWLQQNSNSWLN